MAARIKELKTHMRAHPRSSGQSGLDGKELLVALELLEAASAPQDACPCLPCQDRKELSQKISRFLVELDAGSSSA